MHETTYFGFLNSIIGDEEAIDLEKSKIDARITQISEQLRSRLSPSNVPGLLLHLAMKEMERVAPLVGIPISDLAGHARFLRALSASVPFDSYEPCDDPKVDDLLVACDELWKLMFYREMIDDLRVLQADGGLRKQRTIAAMTSLLSAVQGELAYIEQIEERVERIFSPFSHDIIQPSLGLSTADVVSGFRIVRKTIEQRMRNYHEKMRPMVEAWSEWRRTAISAQSDAALEECVRSIPNRNHIGEQAASGFRMINELLVFKADDFRMDLGERAHRFLDAFSFIPGDENSGVRTPYDDDVVRRRPFAKIGKDLFVLVDVFYSSFAPPHRFLECFDTDKKLQRLNKKRDSTLEDEAAELFNSVIGADKMLRTYYLPVGTNDELAERDLLILKNDCVFVIESKAHALRPLKQRRDKLRRIETDVKRSIQEGYDQALTVIRYLQSEESPIDVLNSDGIFLDNLDVSNVRHFIPIVCLDSYYGLIATDLEPWLVPDVEIGFPWVVDRNTLASIILKIDSFEKMREFLLWRRTLHGVAINEDEAVFAGYFVKHGAHKMPPQADIVHLDPNYTDVIEAEYFRRNGLDVDIPAENVGPPAFASMKRSGDEITFKVNERIDDIINIHTGKSVRTNSRKESRRQKGKLGRNDLCPCGSGKKFKKCCLLVE